LPPPSTTGAWRRLRRQNDRSLGVVEWPTVVVVDREGRVVGPVKKGKVAETLERLIEQTP
jgi:hypothetical protein